MFPGRLARVGPAAWWQVALVLAALAGCLALVHDPRRWAQAMALAAPPLLWLLWPPRSRRAAGVRAVVLTAWIGAFAIDAAVRGYLWSVYGAAPNAALVVVAVANTVPAEATEYLALSWPALVPWTALAAGAIAVTAFALAPGRIGPPAAHAPAHTRRIARRAAVVAVALPAVAGYAIKPWRRLHPLAFWPEWTLEVRAQREQWDDLHRWREAAFALARAQRPRIAASRPSTVVLVVADSVNRDNLGLYGYPRDTTPRLDALHRQMPDALVVFREAWSVDAGTIPALRSLLQFGATEASDPAHVLALAREAGWRIWWISTHDDVAIEQVHAGFAHVPRMQSRTPGRASRTPDDALLEPLREALADPSPYKLVVLHAMGAHPHYRLRYPAGDNPFDDESDAVTHALRERGRPFWIRHARDHYDAALRHHDRVVARTLELVREAAVGGGHHAWMYLSDHGQEVGHEIDHAGHSARTAAGYRIPAMVWQNAPRRPVAQDVEARPFRADWASWTLAHLLALRWADERPTRDALDAAYRWERPVLAIEAGRDPGPSS
ncbi:MAG: hypothetical protein RJA99_1874 [Pseudomonadota bacterium]|jgi:heptose-I-phosphate ethanolaminephosphotransferase